MADETSARLLQQLASISADTVGVGVDWEQRPDTPVTGSDETGSVEVGLQGFDVTHVEIHPGWLETADRASLETAVKQAVQGAMTALVDAELERARTTDYATADVHTRLLQLSQEAATAMNDRLRGLGESLR